MHKQKSLIQKYQLYQTYMTNHNTIQTHPPEHHNYQTYIIITHYHYHYEILVT